MNYTIDFYRRGVTNLENYLETLIRNQMTDAMDWQHGGIMSIDQGIVPYNWGSVVFYPAFLYYFEDNRFYKSNDAFRCADELLDFFNTNLHHSGVLDFHMANFYSSPDTAFVNTVLCRLYGFIKDKPTDKKGEEFKVKLYNTIKRTADGIMAGGFHTPNHRWVETAALAASMNITKDQSYLTRINAFLIEGIDCDEEGEYTERSTGGYNYVNNEAMINIAVELDKPEYLLHVRRNLKMMATYVHTNFEIFTQNSTRQDKGVEKIFLDKYLYQYLKAGNLLKDRELLSIAKAITDDLILYGRGYPIDLCSMVTENDLVSIPDDIEPYIFKDFDHHFKQSGLVRELHNGFTMSIIEDNDTFMYLRYKAVDMYIQGGIHFFNERHIRVKNIRKIENGYAMDYHGEGKYYLPYGEYQGTSDFNQMDLKKRGTTKPITVDALIEVTHTEKGYRIHIKTQGCRKVCIRFDIALNSNATVFGNGYTIRANAGGILVAGKGYVKAELGSCGVKMGPAFADTFITEGLFGSNSIAADKYHVFFNALTPFDNTFTIEPVIKIEE